MQSIPNWPEADESEPLARVRVAASDRHVSAVSVSKSLNADLPKQAFGVGGGSEMSASVEFEDPSPVSERGVSPWSPSSSLPKSGDPISIWLGRDGVECKQLTGYVDGATGSFSGKSISATAVDTVDRLRQRITVDPLLASMPPLGGVGTNYQYRHIGLSATYFTDLFLRRCGFYSTPKRHKKAVFSAPLMGSLWPEVGSCYKASGVNGQNPLFYASPWGLGLGDGDANYYPWFGTAGVSGKLDQTLQITFMVHRSIPDDADPAGVTVRWRTGVPGNTGEHYIRLRVQNGRAIYLQTLSGGVYKDVCALPASRAATATTFTARILRGGGCSINADNGAYVSGTFSPSVVMREEVIDSVGVNATGVGGALIGAAQVAFTEDTQWKFAPTADITHAEAWRQLDASPFLEGRMCLDLLNEQAEAECAAWWIDENGKFVWRNRSAMISSTVVDTVTSERDIFDLTWESNQNSVYSRVTVNNRIPNISIGQNYHLDAYQGSGTELEVGETHKEIITAGSDEDWIMVDDTAVELGDPGAGADDLFNRGYNTWVGATRVSDGANPTEVLANWAANHSLTRVNAETYKYRVTVPTGSIASTERVHLRTPGDGFTTAFWPKRREYNLPVIRCKAIVDWVDGSTTGNVVGPADAPEFEHDAGWWVQSAAALADLRDWLSEQVTVARPLVTGLDIDPHHRLQLGDIVYVRDSTMTSTRLTFLITGIDISQTGETNQTMSLSGRVIGVANLTPTYGEVDVSNSSSTYKMVDSAHSPKTYEQVEAQPFTS